jgi:hypothetical protein
MQSQYVPPKNQIQTPYMAKGGTNIQSQYVPPNNTSKHKTSGGTNIQSQYVPPNNTSRHNTLKY